MSTQTTSDNNIEYLHTLYFSACAPLTYSQLFFVSRTWPPSRQYLQRWSKQLHGGSLLLQSPQTQTKIVDRDSVELDSSLPHISGHHGHSRAPRWLVHLHTSRRRTTCDPSRVRKGDCASKDALFELREFWAYPSAGTDECSHLYVSTSSLTLQGRGSNWFQYISHSVARRIQTQKWIPWCICTALSNHVRRAYLLDWYAMGRSKPKYL